MAKSKYETNVKDKLILVEGWARNGLTDEQIAKDISIKLNVFYITTIVIMVEGIK
ncbi:hypothetical protein K144316041_09110 [Clostridium tetani]|uniref:hypothetical protein n=1 Tax=Clostridium tetani TaxID=1513 RepID=UPI0003C0CA55|nr:hypothetical protein [Clostridium tetani]BDR72203.1 hypothetical protein K144316041_09110 [Clostridium tetani]CDI49164.1 phage-like protein [Clostridium tetani 12124569]